jgi:predicted P-loop ATPase
LKDPTGSRRFWPVEVGALDLAAICADRDQLWAEALTLYRAGTTWHLSREDAQEMQALSEDFQEEDSWEPLIVQWLEHRMGAPFSIRDLFDGPLDVEVAQRHRAHENRVGLILRKLGCERAGRLPPSEGRAYLWRLPWGVS